MWGGSNRRARRYGVARPAAKAPAGAVVKLDADHPKNGVPIPCVPPARSSSPPRPAARKSSASGSQWTLCWRERDSTARSLCELVGSLAGVEGRESSSGAVSEGSFLQLGTKVDGQPIDPGEYWLFIQEDGFFPRDADLPMTLENGGDGVGIR